MKDLKVLTFDFEIEQHSKGYVNVCGVDEAGRGPLAGNVVAGAVIIPEGVSVEGINDSKKLSEKKRDELYEYITSNMIWSVAWATPSEIDELNILNATMLAMKRAIEKLSTKADFALIDGNCSRGFSIPTKTVIGGDAKSPSIAAASIIAKVTRDRQCLELDEKYPEYGFKKHKGYPTKEHMDAVRKLGPCPEHRLSFLKFLENQ
ncbi:MAG: ribonuclease HII [Clostridiales bacterium]|nr:ribonuclease HII [Clostridiales bacterium]